MKGLDCSKPRALKLNFCDVPFEWTLFDRKKVKTIYRVMFSFFLADWRDAYFRAVHLFRLSISKKFASMALVWQHKKTGREME